MYFTNGFDHKFGRTISLLYKGRFLSSLVYSSMSLDKENLQAIAHERGMQWEGRGMQGLRSDSAQLMKSSKRMACAGVL